MPGLRHSRRGRPAPAAIGTPFGPRLHAPATCPKTFQSLSYERLQATPADLFGVPVSQGGLTNLRRRAQGCFRAGREQASREPAVAALRRAAVLASDETSAFREARSPEGQDQGQHRLRPGAQAECDHGRASDLAVALGARCAGQATNTWPSPTGPARLRPPATAASASSGRR